MTIRLFGEGLDALLFAAYLSRKKINFFWFVTHDRLGGFFRGATNCFDNPVDVGMVLLEPNTYSSVQKHLKDFEGQSAQDARPYLNAAYHFLERIMGAHSRIPIKSRLEEDIDACDYFISDHLEAFQEYESDKMLSQLVENLDWIRVNPDWHPRNKRHKNGIFSSTGIQDYFTRVYGEEFYKIFFERYLQNLLGKDLNKLPAGSHRRAWLPLYWPETLIESIIRYDGKVNLVAPSFTRPESGSVAQWVINAKNEIAESVNAKLINIDFLDPADFDYFRAETDFAFVDERLMKNWPAPPVLAPSSNVELRIVHFCGEVDESSVVFLRNNKFGCFRISRYKGTSRHGGISLEFGGGSVNLNDRELVEKSRAIVDNLSFNSSCDAKIFKVKFQINGQGIGEKSREHLVARHTNTFHNLSSMSFNDNIVRGAWAAEIVGGKVDV